MKLWEVTYTLDKGQTYKTMSVRERDRSKAYIAVLLKIPREGIITDVVEIQEESEK